VCASANGRGLVRHGLLHPPSADLAAIVAPLVAEPGAAIAVDFRRWLSITSADVVAHSDPNSDANIGPPGPVRRGIRLTDPRRMGVYFAKYGTVKNTSTTCPASG
jgi:hypothetical protein